MISLPRTLTAAAIAALTLGLLCSAAAAQTGAKIAITNPGRVFNEIQETKDLVAKMETERQTLESQQTEKRKKIEDLQREREMLKADSPQYAERSRALLQAQLDLRVWQEITTQELGRMQKMQMKSIFDKMTGAISEVAQQKGLDLVIAEHRLEVPNLEQITLDQLKALLNQRNVLFANPAVDITGDVIAAMDAKYKAGQ